MLMNAIRSRGPGPILASAFPALLLTAALGAQSGQSFKPGKIPDTWLDKGANPSARKDSEPDAARAAQLAKLLSDKRVLLVRVRHAWHPKLGAKVQDCAGGWLAFKGKKALGFFAESLFPKEGEIKARRLDLSKQSAELWLTPGLVDANSRWFRDSADLRDSKANPATKASALLMTWQEGWEQLQLRGGLTKVYAPASLVGFVGGQGALVELDRRRGPRLATKKSALDIRISTPSSNGSNLSRAAAVEGLARQFQAAKKYREAKEKFAKDLKNYAKQRKDFLAYYKKHPLKPGQKAAATQPKTRRISFRPSPQQLAIIRKLPPPQRMAALRKMALAAQAKSKTATKKPAPKKGAKTAAKAPPRPKYPKQPKDNPALDELLRVLDGELPLRIEAHRKGEIRALLKLMAEHGLRNWTLLGATEALPMAEELRRAGVRVVLSPSKYDERRFELLDEHVPHLAALLAKKGVEVALASADKNAGPELRLLAARAVAWGMPEHSALSAISAAALRCTPGGGSEDLVLWTAHPLSPSSHPMAVIRNGKVQLLSKSSAKGQAGEKK